jgi:hypothetical protein
MYVQPIPFLGEPSSTPAELLLLLLLHIQKQSIVLIEEDQTVWDNIEDNVGKGGDTE